MTGGRTALLVCRHGFLALLLVGVFFLQHYFVTRGFGFSVGELLQVTQFYNQAWFFGLMLPPWLGGGILVFALAFVATQFAKDLNNGKNALSLVFFLVGGTLNLLPRLLTGRVLDPFVTGRLAWNLADLYIVLGLVGVMLNSLKRSKP